MNKKGQVIIFGIMMFVMLYITAVQLLTPLKDQVADVRNSTNMNCSNPDNSIGASASCIMIDWSTFWWFGSALVAAIGYITFRKIRAG